MVGSYVVSILILEFHSNMLLGMTITTVERRSARSGTAGAIWEYSGNLHNLC